MKRVVHLHGALAKFAKKLVVDADTTQMVVQGLICQLGNKFKQTIREGSFHIYRGKKSLNNDMSEDEVGMTLGMTQELHFYPVVNAKSAVARIVIGVVLIVVGAFTSVFSGGTSTILVQAGAALALGGVAELLAPKPNLSGTQEQSGQNASFIFNGTINVTEQGGPPPVVYGRVRRASSLVLSVGLTVENI